MTAAFWLALGLAAVPDWLMWALIAATTVALGAVGWIGRSR